MPDKKICTRCILDSGIQDIWFDEKGECKYCYIHDEMEKTHQPGIKLNKEFQKKIRKIRHEGSSKKYDCIAGVSGGLASLYLLLQAVRLVFRPLAVHFDMAGIQTSPFRILKKPVKNLMWIY